MGFRQPQDLFAAHHTHNPQERYHFSSASDPWGQLDNSLHWKLAAPRLIGVWAEHRRHHACTQILSLLGYCLQSSVGKKTFRNYHDSL